RERFIVFRTLVPFQLLELDYWYIEYALLMTGILAVGHIGKLELAACTLGSMTANVTSFSIVIGMGGALDTVLPGVWGASANSVHDSESKARIRSGRSDSEIVDSRLFVLYFFLLIPMLCIWLHAEGILVLLRQDKDVARLAGKYLAMFAFGLPAFSFIIIAKRYFQEQGLFSVPTKIGTIVAGVNVLLTAILGFDGAPLATSISYNLVALGSIFWGWKIEVARRKRREACEIREEQIVSASEAYHIAHPSNETSTSDDTAVSYLFEKLINFLQLQPAKNHEDPYQSEMRSAWHPLSMRALHPTGLGTLLTLGLGGVGQTASEWWAWELVGLAASLLGPTALAAQSVLLVSCSDTYQVPFALGIATSVRIGQLLELGRPRLAKLAAHAAILLGLVLALVFSAIFWIWRKKWAYLFNDDEDVATMVAAILPLVALFQVFDGNAAITVETLPDHPIVHTLRDQITTMLSSSSPTPSLPSIFKGSAVSSPLQELNVNDPVYPSLSEATAGLRGLWTGLTVSLVLYCAVLGTILCLATNWEHEVAKVKARVRAEDRDDRRENASNDTGDTAVGWRICIIL
ncbi:mate-domain-containing protein, partial [Lentinula detonsa]